jgi:N-acetylmuramoyl-L-alanine amidase
MIVLSKKRLLLITSMVLVSLFVFVFQTVRVDNNNSTVPTVALPVSNKVIVLDAGHGIPDEGAQSSNGTTEAQTNLKIALKVQNLLEQSGATVILTRSDENAIYDLDSKTLKEKKISDIHNRVKIGNENSADIFVSIHLNKIPQNQYWGWQCFYKDGNEQSTKLAKSLQSNLNESIQKENKRVAMKLDTVYIMKHVEVPISIVECGFLSNPEEEKLLLKDSYQDKLAWGIYNGIIDYFY